MRLRQAGVLARGTSFVFFSDVVTGQCVDFLRRGADGLPPARPDIRSLLANKLV